LSPAIGFDKCKRVSHHQAERLAVALEDFKAGASRRGDFPNMRVYSRLNCEALSYPIWNGAVINVGAAGDRQAAGLKKTKLLLILQRCHRSDGLELPMKSGGTPGRGDSQIFCADRPLPVSRLMDSLDDASLMAVRDCHADLGAAGPVRS
jgi:hypothetical protein